MIRRFLCGLWALLLAVLAPSQEGAREAWPPRGQAVAVRASAEVESASLLGDVAVLVELWRRADAPEAATAFVPVIPEGFIGSIGPPRSEELPADGDRAGGTLVRWAMDLQPAALGELSIPPFEVALGGGRAARSDELMVQVSGVLPEGAAVPDPARDAAADPPPPAEGALPEAPSEPFPEPVDRSRWYWLALAVLAGVLAGALVWRALGRRDAMPRQVDVPADVRALRELARLRSAPRDSQGQIDAFYVAVSAALRTYIEARFGLHAPERTTEEFLREADASGAIPQEQRPGLAHFLEQCDLVKFARQVPGEDVHARTLATAEAFVHATCAQSAENGGAGSGGTENGGAAA